MEEVESRIDDGSLTHTRRGSEGGFDAECVDFRR